MNSASARLFYLIGPSGAGKDSLLRALATRGAPGPRIARRYITRPARPDDEPHEALGTAEFETREQAGEFLFSWRSHGYGYAIGREVLGWIDSGDDVIVNGSRDYLERALRIYPRLSPIWLTAPEDLLRRRLLARGRETAAEIEARLVRNRLLEASIDTRYPRILNNASIDAALARLDAAMARQ